MNARVGEKSEAELWIDEKKKKKKRKNKFIKGNVDEWGKYTYISQSKSTMDYLIVNIDA